MSEYHVSYGKFDRLWLAQSSNRNDGRHVISHTHIEHIFLGTYNEKSNEQKIFLARPFLISLLPLTISKNSKQTRNDKTAKSNTTPNELQVHFNRLVVGRFVPLEVNRHISLNSYNTDFVLV